MSSDDSSKNVFCPACHAKVQIGDAKCWLCGATISSIETSASTTQVGPGLPKAGQTASFSLSTLMMIVTLVAIICGLISIAPGIGIALALVLVPVLAHTFIAAQREKSKGHAIAPSERIALFFGSLGLVVVAGVAASIAFGITCFGGFFAGAAAGEALGAKGYDSIGWGAFVGIGLGAIAGAFVGYRALIALSRNSTMKWEGIRTWTTGSKLFLASAVVIAVIGAVIVFLLNT